MRVYFSTPANQAQAQVLIDADAPALLSFALMQAGIVRSYASAFSRVLVDSGAYSELTTGATVDVGAYREFVSEWRDKADACAGLDDISGDWRRSLANYEAVPETFPTYHDTDPPELLPELVALSRERGNWLGIGLMPPRLNRHDWLRRTLDAIPEEIHVHGWALRRYRYFSRWDSVDSSNWYRDSQKVLIAPETRHLTPIEALRIVLLRYQRETKQEEPCESLSLQAVG